MAHLIDSDHHKWKVPLVLDLFDANSANAILSIPIHSRTRPNKLVWIPDSKGCFSVKSAYKEIVNLSSHPTTPIVDWRKLWKLKGLERIKLFLWRVVFNALPTKENLMCRMQVEDPCCVLCNQEVETFDHIFLCCLVAKALWFSICWGFRSDEFPLATSKDIINLILNPPEALCQA